MNDKHECNQEVTLNTICIKLTDIEKSISKIESTQTVFIERLETLTIRDAQRPTPKEIKEVCEMVKQHDTYLKLIGGTLVLAWGFITAIALKRV